MCAESIDDDFATGFREVDFDAKAEAFFGNEDGGIVGAFLQYTEGFEIFVFMEALTFMKTFGGEGIVDFTRWTKSGS